MPKGLRRIRRLLVLMKFLILSAIFLGSATLGAQTVAHVKVMVHTEQVDLGYETFGTQPATGAAIPVIAVNGGPRPFHRYIEQNDLCECGRTKRPRGFFHQRGTREYQPPR